MLVIIAVAGLVAIILGTILAKNLSREGKPGIGRTIKTVGWLSGLTLVSLAVFNGLFFYAEPGYKYHVRTLWGTEIIVDGVGYQVLGFGRKNAWKKAMTVQAVSNDSYVAEGNTDEAEEEGSATSASLPPQTILFLDQVDARAQATARFRLPADKDQFLQLVHEYRTPANLLTTSLIPAFRETLQATGSLLSAEEYYSGGRTEFNTEFENQMQNGIYIVRRQEVVVDDPSAVAPGSANAAKGTDQDTFGDQKRVIFKVQKLMKNGIPLRKDQKYTTFGITVVDARVTDMVPNDKFVDRMRLKQKASADRAIAREQRIQEEEQRLLAIAKGEREVAQRQADAKVEQIQKTTDAETQRQLAVTAATLRKDQADIDKQTSAVRLEQAKIDAEAIRVTAEAEAYRKKAIIEADNALAQKLEAYIKVQETWAQAFANRRVPQQIFGGSGDGTGSDSDAKTFMDILTVKAARDLSFDPGVAKGAPKQ